MILHRTRLHHIGTPFRAADVVIDWDTLPAGLIAIVGPNGAGKTTLLEAASVAPLFRAWPSYGLPFRGLVAPGVRDAFVESIFSLGEKTYRALVQADPGFGGGKGKEEGYLAEVGAATPPAGPNVREFDAAIARLLPSRALLLASVFAGQGRRGAAASFFGLARADRRALFVRLLGVDHLQELAERAAAAAEGELRDLDGLRRTLGERRAQARRAAELAEALAAARAALAAQGTAHAAADRALRAGEEALAGAREDLATRDADARAVRQRNAERQAAAEAARAERERLCGRLAALEAELTDADAVEAAVGALGECEAALEAEREGLARLDAALAPLHAEHARLETRLSGLRVAERRLGDEVETLRAAAARVAALPAVAAETDAAAGAVAQATAALGAAQRHADALAPREVAEAARLRQRRSLEQEHQGLLGEADRLAHLEEPQNPLCGRCPFTRRAREAATRIAAVEAELAELPTTPEVGAARQRAVEAMETCRRERDAALARLAALRERLAALEPVAEQAARREALEAELAAMVEEGKGLRARTGAVGVEVARRAAARAELAERIAALLERRRGLAATAGRAPAMAAARAEHATLVEQRRAPLEAPIPEVEPDLAPLRSRVGALRDALAGRQATARTAAAALAAATARQARLEGEGAALGEPAAEAARLAAAEAAAVEAGADWRVLARDLGPNGLQALEIELAGPAVSQIANALLAACYGSRFALALETLAERKTGAGTKDVFEVRLLDSATGRVGTEGSGGEQVILDEALRLALALYNQHRSGGALRTLFRDEVDGQLDPENAHRYVGMLRRAVALGGLHRVVFISHRPEVWAQADARLVVADGTATVDPPPALGAAA